MVFVKWMKPSLGWFKLNTDGSSVQQRKVAGGGGVIRDGFGNWVVGFSIGLNFTSSVMVELSALRDGLIKAKSVGIKKIVVELDAKVVVSLITDSSKTKKSINSSVMDCQNLLQGFEECIVQHTYREGNRVADVHAKMGSYQVDKFFIHYHYAPPNPETSFLLALDNMNVLTARRLAV
nr:putative ribonuclease h protein [Quercus suber]